MAPFVTKMRPGWFVMSMKTFIRSCGPFAHVSSLANHSVVPPAIGLAVKFAELFDIDDPTRLIGCVDPAMPLLMSVKINDAVRVPVAFGLNFTLTTHEAPGIRLAPAHVLPDVWKSVALSPLTCTPAIDRFASPMLVIITGMAMLGTPIGWLEKLTLVGLRLAMPTGVTVTMTSDEDFPL